MLFVKSMRMMLCCINNRLHRNWLTLWIKLNNGLSTHVYILMSEKLLFRCWCESRCICPGTKTWGSTCIHISRIIIIFSFKKHVKKVVNIVKFNFRFIRNTLTNEAAVLFINSMIIPHNTYCMTTWTQTCRSLLKPVKSIYNQTTFGQLSFAFRGTHE